MFRFIEILNNWFCGGMGCDGIAFFLTGLNSRKAGYNTV